ncbi:hypothetical protein PVAND_002053 [Polypedilum vanderplanki]|uniref:Uncharacterized protein n=1 Tax=Polypedilum vanderplanki TaxID=319348 RepID=A0A9J6BR21_POLVA|nr:hypothetical protein PVAND_002053 [Polypedilum vanderplanki]
MNEQKLIPALVFKNTCDEEYEIYNLPREVFVRNLYLPSKTDMLHQIINQQIINNDGDFVKKYVSSVKIIPRFKIEHIDCKIKISSQPFNKQRRIIYKTACNIHRNYTAEVQMEIQVFKTQKSTEIKWKTSVSFDI